MAVPIAIQSLLPQKFFGLVPLFIGVEIILGITILNKASGLYGILSLFTGHPINFLQWLYNSLALLMLPVYASAAISLENKVELVRKISFATLVFCIDTLIGLFYTVYFMYLWFSEEGSSGTTTSALFTRGGASSYADLEPSSKSASTERELFFIFSTTLVTILMRIYFTLTMLSFAKVLLKQNSLESRYKTEINLDGENGSDQLLEDAAEIEISNSSGLSGEVKKLLYDLEMRSKDFLDEMLN
ncbi:uncharacterized protein LODBEIA_P06950 [Lodderomyces beijingensis]|uniref:Inositol phosphorylceramide synthase regulatory subunit KEI1 n=1 Tax=Lodderomyces beijingensis TaxID=1775926 RepID=A0ABP0ZH82_9ASCO